MMPTATDELTIEADGPVRILTLNRPSKLNSISETLHERLTTVWPEIALDRDARAVVVTGAGRAFSAGGDFDYLKAGHDDAFVRDTAIGRDRAIQTAMLRFPLPVIAAVNGPAVGLGSSLALGCDLVLMSDKAYIADPHVSVGLVAGDGGVTFWPALTSMLRVKEYLFTGDRVTPEVAVSLGLANRVVPHEELLPEALLLAHRIAKQPPEALRGTKAALTVIMEQLGRGGMEAALAAERDTMSSADHLRIIEAFMEKHAAAEKRDTGD